MTVKEARCLWKYAFLPRERAKGVAVFEVANSEFSSNDEYTANSTFNIPCLFANDAYQRYHLYKNSLNGSRTQWRCPET